MLNLLEHAHFIKGLDPVADAFSGTVYSDIVNMKNFAKAVFQLYKGVGTTGTSTITVEACDDVAGSNVVAIPFRYRAITTNDSQGNLNQATAAGFTTTAGSSQMYLIEVDENAMGASGYQYVRLKAVEVVDSPVLGGITIALHGKRQSEVATAIV
jgi:hypothetical protein